MHTRLEELNMFPKARATKLDMAAPGAAIASRKLELLAMRP
jgi:hypothetical protein